MSAYDRRKLFKLMGLSASAWAYHHTVAGFVFKSIARGMISNAHAQAVGNYNKNHIVLLYGGAPPQWNFLPLRINGNNDPYIHNTSVTNAIIGNNYMGTGGGHTKGLKGNVTSNSNARYLLEKFTITQNGSNKDIYLPALWAHNIPTSSGGWLPMIDMIKEMMIIRGVHMEIDIGHSAGPQRIVQPDLTLPSLSGIVADESAKIISGITTRSKHNGFKTPSGSSEVILGSGTKSKGGPLEKLLQPFNETDSSVISSSAKRAAMDSLVNSALQELEAHRKSGLPGADFLYKNHRNVETVLKKNFGNFANEYQTLYAKYYDLSKRCLDPIENISLAQKDVKVIVPGTQNTYDNLTQKYSLIPAAQTNSSGKFSHKAMEGALTEFLIKHNLTSSITIGGPGSNTGNVYVQSDEHGQTNRQGSAIAFNYMYRNMMAFVNELKTVCQKYGQWDDTVIQVGAEYGRNPSNNALTDGGGGSDHATACGWTVCFSGSIDEPIIMGNTKINSNKSLTHNKMGTYAARATTQFKSGSESILLRTPHMVGAVADLLNVQNPIRNTKKIIEKNNGKWRSLLEWPKNTDS